jgi:hypothetical protein
VSTPTEPDDPGRDPEGLDPPRDILDSNSGVPEQGSFRPHTSTQPSDTPSDQPPTSTEGSGP